MSAAAKSTKQTQILDEFFDDDDLSVDSPRDLSESSDNVSSVKETIDLSDDDNEPTDQPQEKMPPKPEQKSNPKGKIIINLASIDINSKNRRKLRAILQ
jgi:hypothetical protein